ncbi:MAG: phosphotransferase [Clostridiales bacterium]|nr:phosphotransferase [Clostridiales bacterium]
MDNEIRLTGGRITQAVMRRGDFVHRSVCANSPFVHEVLRFLEGRNANRAPRFHGIDERGREILDYIDGTVPDNLGRFSAEQCRQAARIIKTLHDHLKYFPGCPDGWTVCHNDLSPCNFVFAGGEPIAVIDWDAAAFGHPLDDLAYAAWMWLDIGNKENSFSSVNRRIRAMLDAYGASVPIRDDFGPRMLIQMDRVAAGAYPTKEQADAARAWAFACKAWLASFLSEHPSFT